MADSVADTEVVMEEELLFDDPPREAPPRRDELVREGEVLAGKYRVERIPGRNGLGVLVQVRHMELGQEVTLKFLVPDACMYPEYVQRFIREARAAVKIQGEHVARVTDVGRLASGAPYMVREFLRGPDLSEVVKVRGPLPTSEACDYIIQAAEAVAEAHVLGIAHRNLRPTTLVVTRRSDGAPLLKVFDFAAGEALHVEPFTQRSVSLVGSSALLTSLPYLSPEQVRDPHGVDFRADVYALGAILYELLSGVAPFEAESAPALLAMVAADSPAPLHTFRSDLPEGLEQVVLCCLAKPRDLRFPNIAELALALGPYASTESASSIERIVRLAQRAKRPPSVSDARVAAPSVAVASSAARVSVVQPSYAPPAMPPEPCMTQPVGSYVGAPQAPPLRASSVPPPLTPSQVHESVPPAATAQAAPPPNAPSSTKTTIMPPAPHRSSIPWGLSRSSRASAMEGAPWPMAKLGLVALVVACVTFALVNGLRGAGVIGQQTAAARQPALTLLGTRWVPAPVALPAVPAPTATVPASLPAAPSAPASASAAPGTPAVANAGVAPTVRPIAPAVHAAAPIRARAAAVPVVRPVQPSALEPTADEAPRSPAKVAAAVPAKAKDLFSDPD
jgi:serine/threonine protein kinase